MSQNTQFVTTREKERLRPVIQTLRKLVAALVGDGYINHRIGDRNVAQMILDRHDVRFSG